MKEFYRKQMKKSLIALLCLGLASTSIFALDYNDGYCSTCKSLNGKNCGASVSVPGAELKYNNCIAYDSSRRCACTCGESTKINDFSCPPAYVVKKKEPPKPMKNPCGKNNDKGCVYVG